MSRPNAIARAYAYFDNGGFLADLTRRVAIPSSSQEPERASALRDYLVDEIVPALTRLGFTCRVLDNPLGPPVMVAERMENSDFVTALVYGHGDTIRGFDDLWRPGLTPWQVVVEGERIYGRGTADNKGQHSVNIGALAAVLAERGALGFNCKILIEMGEEVGSVGLRELCAQHRGGLLKADVLIASDGPRIAPDKPTIFLGARGTYLIDLFVNLREGSHHSGNWGGLIANPAIILAHALASITDARGTIRVPDWRPALPQSVRDVLAGVEVDGGEDGPKIDRDWGEPGLTPAERVFGWNSFEILAFTTGTPERPVNAIPGAARAHCQLRYVVGTDVGRHHPGAAAASRPPRLSPGRAASRPRQLLQREPPRSGRSVGELDQTIDGADDWARADHPAQSRRLAAQRCVRRRAQSENALGAAFLRRLFAARARTNTCWRRSPARDWASWPGCSGIWVTRIRSARRIRRVKTAVSETG